MKSHVLLLGRVLAEAGTWCCTSTIRDYEYVTDRVEHEGLSFLTITLPSFGLDFEQALSKGCVDSTLFHSFRKSASLPAFLQGLTSLVFNRCSGTLLDDPSIDAIQCIRQICNLFKSLLHPCSDTRVKAAFDKYIECDNQVWDNDMRLKPSDAEDFSRIALLLFGDLLAEVDRKIVYQEIIPKHGPGATADRIKGNQKYDNRVWTDRLEKIFPCGDFLFSSPSHFLEAREDITWLEPGAELPSRVVSVPKTLKTPRIIAIEPCHKQFVQQGLMAPIVDGIEGDDFLSSIIGFRDQSYNRFLARQGSRVGDLATLDLSEASDRVSNQHVRLLLKSAPSLWEAAQASRSRKADVPGYGIRYLSKFASMGSALTFPIEAMVFTTLVFLGIERELNVPLTRKSVRRFSGKVRTYGDDIIVPVGMVHSVIETLEAFGLKVNHNKSFWTGKFRESCGGDYYDGEDVSYVRCRRDLPTSRKQAQEVVSAESLRNQLYYAGWWETAAYLDELLARIIPMPVIQPGSPGLGRISFLGYQTDRECPWLQRPLVKAAVITTKIPDSPVSGPGALLKYFLKQDVDELDIHSSWATRLRRMNDLLSPPIVDAKHLERAGRPVVVDIKLRWVTPY